MAHISFTESQKQNNFLYLFLLKQELKFGNILSKLKVTKKIIHFRYYLLFFLY